MIVADPVPAPGVRARLIGWAQRHLPTRESVEANRWLRPIAHLVLAPSLWRFNRRSVPRGVAVGLTTSVLVPVAHMPAAALFAIPFRANLPIAVGITIPSTLFIPFNLWAAYRIGRYVLGLNRAVGSQIADNVNANAGWLHWLFAQGGPATIVGLLILAAGVSIAGYFLAKLGWRLRVARKWRRRRLRAAARA